MRRYDELRVGEMRFQQLAKLVAMARVDGHHHIVQQCDREALREKALHQGEVKTYPHAVLMPLAVISAGREKTALVEIHVEIEPPLAGCQLRRELRLIVLIDQTVESAEIVLNVVIESIQLLFHDATIGLVGCPSRIAGGLRGLVPPHGVAVVIEAKLRCREKRLRFDGRALVRFRVDLGREGGKPRRSSFRHFGPSTAQPLFQTDQPVEIPKLPLQFLKVSPPCGYDIGSDRVVFLFCDPQSLPEKAEQVFRMGGEVAAVRKKRRLQFAGVLGF